MTPPTDRKGLLQVMVQTTCNNQRYPDEAPCSYPDCQCLGMERTRGSCDIAMDMLTAIEAAGVRLMPAEATEVQISAAYSREIKDDERAYVGIYRAMRDASPYAEKKA